ncbi:hypothetical protein HH308_04365 [Gordonia sp. TBRC 11910]|uniref:Uncharacterized protein n=1 Tax=Gordonia asplenii TaxID=2725283 RepID=A0A848KP39_9ACTN|nr:hypothetical protein [Gordonia asplenii]NMO00446.1 hypothetical protein [Gordonia asplenii]
MNTFSRFSAAVLAAVGVAVAVPAVAQADMYTFPGIGGWYSSPGAGTQVRYVFYSDSASNDISWMDANNAPKVQHVVFTGRTPDGKFVGERVVRLGGGTPVMSSSIHSGGSFAQCKVLVGGQQQKLYTMSGPGATAFC